METVTVTQPRTSQRLLWTPQKGPFVQSLGRYLVKSEQLESAESFVRVSDEAARVLGQCLPPGGSDARRTGLVIGYVQSGKTMSMATVATLARDNKFRIIIAISGTTDNLFDQSCERFERDLRGSESRPAQWTIVRNPTRATHGRDLERLVKDWRDARLREEHQQSLFITVMKNHSRLRDLADLLGCVSLAGIDAIIIDDEADQAGLNTRPQEDTASTTYQRIGEIRANLPKHTYLQYTATAQAIILISLLDMLSPDFADVLEAGADYTGGRAFFVDRKDLIEDIPTAELPAQIAGNVEPPPSLLKALRLFYLSAVASPRANNERNRSMLVHPDRRVGIQRSYFDWIHESKERWGDLLRRPVKDDERQELAAEFAEPYESLKRTAREIRPLPELLDELAVEIPRTIVTEVNSASGSEVAWSNGFTHILVGGQKLERGYTVKGLVVTYMPRGPGTWTADTIQQRARFFGYKRLYLGFCRVFLENNIRDLYEEYVDHEESLREQIIAFRGKPTKELRRAFILDGRYQPTRRNVLTEPFYRRTFGEGWLKQSAPHLAGDLERNVSLVEAFLREHPLADHPEYQCQLTEDVSLAEVKELLTDLTCGPGDAVDRQIAVYCLTEEIKKSRGRKADIILMQRATGEPRKRSLEKGRVQIHQGRSGNYPGDAEVYSADRLTLQIHWVRVVEENPAGKEIEVAKRVPALALHVPKGWRWSEWLIQNKGDD